MANLVFDGMTGELTTEDIQEGIRCDHEACPLARALENMFPGYYAFVDDYAVLHDTKGEVIVDMPLSDPLLTWVDRFDNEKPVDPIKLHIRTHTIGAAEWILGIVGEDQWIK